MLKQLQRLLNYLYKLPNWKLVLGITSICVVIYTVLFIVFINLVEYLLSYFMTISLPDNLFLGGMIYGIYAGILISVFIMFLRKFITKINFFK